MTTSTYRCAGCREYKPRPEYRRLGLGSVCSAKCLTAASHKTLKARSDISPNNIPPNVTRLPDIPYETRRTVRDRDRGRCRICGVTDGLHLHHIAYRSQGGTHDERNLILLCNLHHSLVHTDKARWQPVLFDYIRAFYRSGVRASVLKLDRERRASAGANE